MPFSQNAEILTIGNEIITGMIQDTNARTIAQRLNDNGITVSRITTVGDDGEQIQRELEAALRRAGIVILTGGLGATHDDVTKKAMADYFKSDMVEDKKVRRMIKALFKSRGREATPLALKQCEVPAAAVVMYNEQGTAPGLYFKTEAARVFAVPGVPHEMEHLLDRYILPELAASGSGCIRHRVLHTTGLPESAIWEQVGPIGELQQWVEVASLPSHLGVRIRLSAAGEDEPDLTNRLDQADAWLTSRLGNLVIGRDDETLEEVVGRLLLESQRTLSLAESCTGGLIASRITRIAGSSSYFLEGAVTYSNAAKSRCLEVPEALLIEHGAVSEPVAAAMASGIRLKSGTDVALSVTGIAGPGGATDDKPVGLVYIGLADSDGTHVECHKFHQDRQRNQDRAAQAALNLLRLYLLGQVTTQYGN